MDLFSLLGVAVGGAALGALAGFFVARARAKREAASEHAAEQAALRERLQGKEELIAALRQELSGARGELEGRAEILRLEAERRAAAEAAAERVPGLEVALEQARREAAEQGERLSELEARLSSEREAMEEKLGLLRETEAKLSDAFKALSADALKSNNQAFLDLAKQALAKEQEQAKGELELKKKGVEELVAPIRESLGKVDAKLLELEQARVTAYVSLTEQVKSLSETQGRLKEETSRLVQALRRPVVRGRWGEIQLRRVVELADMLNYCDFVEQESVEGEEGRLRPDMVVKLPGGKCVVVDAKAPLEAYLSAVEARDEAERLTHQRAHARHIRDHISRLGAKKYHLQFDHSPEFVVMFLPGEAFFTAALDQDPALLEEGVRQGVIVSSPTTLIALLRAVAYGWRQETMAQSARKVGELGRELYERLCVMTGYFERVGKGLGAAVESYNKAVGSLEGRVLVAARKFTELGVAAGKDLGELAPVEKQARDVRVLSPEIEQ